MRHFIRKSSLNIFITASVAIFAGFIGMTTANATASDPKMFVSADNTFYVYAKGGEKLSASFTKSSQPEPGGLNRADATLTLDGPGLTTQSCTLARDIAVGNSCAFTDVLAPETGIYRVILKLPDDAKPYNEVSPAVKWGGNLFSWNISVKDGTVQKSGRVWSELYAVRQPVPESFMTDQTYHYVSESGYIYRASYKGYNGQISTFSADAVGIRKAKDCTSAYQSVSVTSTEFSPSFGECGASYKLFFEEPSGDLPNRAKKWDGKGTDWIVPNVAAPKVTDLTFTSDNSGNEQSGKISYRLNNFVGQYTIDIDTTGDGGFSSQEDVRIKRTMKKVSNDKQEVTFDGIDKRGQVVPASQQISIRVNVEKVAEIHLVNADVEGRAGGLELVRVNGENAPTSRMCWNDTDLGALADTTLQTPTLDGRSCPDSVTEKRHGWAYATGSWGDGRYIDDWAYAAARVEGVAAIKYPDSIVPTMTTSQKNKQLIIIIGAVVLMALFAALVAVFVVKRRRHAKLVRDVSRQHQPIDYPGPGDPGPPRV